MPVDPTGKPLLDCGQHTGSKLEGVIEIRTIESPIGTLTLAVRGGRLCVLHFGSDHRSIRASLRRWYPDEPPDGPIDTRSGAEAVEAILARYFAGETDALDGIDVEMNGTSFQRRVWAALRDVKAGTTASSRRDRAAHRRDLLGPRRGRRQRRQSRRDSRALPPHHRRQRQPHRLRWRPRTEAVAASPRAGPRPLLTSAAAQLLRFRPNPSLIRFLFALSDVRSNGCCRGRLEEYFRPPGGAVSCDQRPDSADVRLLARRRAATPARRDATRPGPLGR